MPRPWRRGCGRCGFHGGLRARIISSTRRSWWGRRRPDMEIWTAFILGLAGSLHCAGMCGPLALALPAAGKGPWGFVLGRAAYNLGRIITYCALGILFGLIGKTLW